MAEIFFPPRQNLRLGILLVSAESLVARTPPGQCEILTFAFLCHFDRSDCLKGRSGGRNRLEAGNGTDDDGFTFKGFLATLGMTKKKIFLSCGSE